MLGSDDGKQYLEFLNALKRYNDTKMSYFVSFE